MAATQAGLKSASTAIEIFRVDHDRLPDRLEDLIERPSYVHPSHWPTGGYQTEPPVDGWHRSFIYEITSSSPRGYRLLSYGQDGQPGGKGLCQDIGPGKTLLHDEYCPYNRTR